MNILVPLMTHRSFLHSARVLMLSESDPDPGSVRAHAPSILPEARSGRYFLLIDSEPNARIWATQSELWEATVRPSDPSPFPISSTAIA
jgi:hypothetical protein